MRHNIHNCDQFDAPQHLQLAVTICSGPIAFISDSMSRSIYNYGQFDAPQHS